MYKVVAKQSGRYYSAQTERAGRVEYKMNEWVEAPGFCKKRGYHLLVFDCLSYADEFARLFYIPGKKMIFEVDVENEIKDLPTMCDLHLLDYSEKISPVEDRDNWFPGTRMFERVKLLKEINL